MKIFSILRLNHLNVDSRADFYLATKSRQVLEGTVRNPQTIWYLRNLNYDSIRTFLSKIQLQHVQQITNIRTTHYTIRGNELAVECQCQILQ